MKKALVIVLLVFGPAEIITSCAPKATDEEIEQMCDRLLVLRKKEGDTAMKAKCIAEARQEGVSRRQALCRKTAVNRQEYWNRCRTGASN